MGNKTDFTANEYRDNHKVEPLRRPWI